MKKLLMITSLIFSGSIFAQSTDNTCKRMDKMETFLKDSIKISADQQSKISAVHAEYCPKLQAVKSAENTSEDKKKELKTLRKEVQAKYKEILTDEQLKSLKAKRKAKKEHRKNHPKKKMDAQSMTNKMTEELGLTETQKPKVLALNQQLIDDRKTIRTQAKEGAEKDQVKTARKAAMKKYKDGLKEVLTEEQLKTLKSKRKKRGQKGQSAEKMTERQTKKLNLTEEQKPKVLALNQKLVADKKAITENGTSDEESNKKAMKELRKKYKSDLKELLTDEQIELMKSKRKKKE